VISFFSVNGWIFPSIYAENEKVSRREGGEGCFIEGLFFWLSFRKRFDIEVSAHNEHKMKKLFLLLLSFFQLSCISQYHRGYHYLGEDKKLYYSVVSEKTDTLSRPFEEKAIRKVMSIHSKNCLQINCRQLCRKTLWDS